MPDDMPPSEPNTVELRSDAPLQPKDPQARQKKMWVIVVGVLVLLIIIVLGVNAARHSGKSGNQTADNTTTNGGQGNLPTSGTTEPVVSNTASGLSGMPCADANRRPIGVMLAGDPINRPLSGVSEADMVWEMPVLTSDVTRLMAVYQCGHPKEMGSVRSARHDYLFLITGLDGILAHWGGSYWALNMINAGQFQTINALVNPFDAFYRKNNLPAPYNGFTSYDRLWNALQKLGYRTNTTFKGYDFKDDAAQADRGAAGTLSIAWPGAFQVSFQYDPSTNRYIKYWAGTKQIDPNNNQPVAPSAVVVVRATNEAANGPGGYNDEGIEGQGDLAVYQDGKEIKGTWKKDINNKQDPMHFLDQSGNPITFTRGQVWVVVPEPSISVTWTAKK